MVEIIAPIAIIAAAVAAIAALLLGPELVDLADRGRATLARLWRAGDRA